VSVVSLRGELDLATAPQLREVLDEIKREGPILINLNDCEFIDSTGIAVIVRAWQQRNAIDGDGPAPPLALCAPKNQVSRLLEMTGIDTSISIFADCEDALDQLRTASGAA
jgi:anti-sigma B factor antagonist